MAISLGKKFSEFGISGFIHTSVPKKIFQKMSSTMKRVKTEIIPHDTFGKKYKKKYRSKYDYYKKMQNEHLHHELNFVDTTFTNVVVSTTAILTLVNGLTQGTTASTRVGRQILMKSVEIKGHFVADSTTSITPVRCMLVLDHQPNGAAPAFTDIYDTAVPSSLRNISNKKRFKVLFDSGIIAITGNTSSSNENTLVPYEHYRKLKVPVQYNSGNAGTIADIATNSLYMCFIGGTASGTADAAFTGQLRIRYED